jgi:hypothetical protein
MYRLILALSLLLPGCASVGRGLDVAQGGMAAVDVGLDRALEQYVAAVQKLRGHCQAQPEPDACALRWGVTDEDVAAVEVAAELMSDGYDETAEGLRKMQAAWQLLWPRMQKVINAADTVSG